MVNKRGTGPSSGTLRTGLTGLTFMGLVAITFVGGYSIGQNQHVARVSAASPQQTSVSRSSQSTTMDMGASATNKQELAATSARTVASSTAADTVYPAYSFANGEKTLPDGMRLATFTLDHGIKVFHLTASEFHWSTTKGQNFTAWGYNGSVPGPEIRVTVGDRVRVIVRNLLPEGTTVHFHGLFVPNNMDGVPMVTQDPIKSGASFTYEFTANPVGTHQYHSHMDDLKQVTNGMYGAFIVDPKQSRAHYDDEFTLIPADGPLGFIISGKSFPDTTPLVVHLGDRVRVRMINMGDMYHPFHLHGFDFREIARDGLPIPEALQMETNEIDAAPGGSYDMTFTADRLGVWAFHCHILDHVTGPNGEMAGMITVVKVVAR